MKKSKLLPLLLVLPMLAGCMSQGNSSAPSSSVAPSVNTSSYSTSISTEPSSSKASSVSSSRSASSSAKSSSSSAKPSSSSSKVNSSSSNAPSSVSTSSSVSKGWTSAQSNLMSKYLYGYSFPYYDMTNYDVSYDKNSLCVVITAPNCTPTDLEGWKTNLVNDGFEEFDTGSLNYYSFEKQVSTTEGKRFIDVEIAAIDKSGYISEEGTGTFMLMAGDPYLYEWPGEYIQQDINYMCEKTATTLPSFKADYYSIDEYYLDSGMLAIYCYTENSAMAEITYLASLNAAKFVISSQTDEDGYYEAVSPDEFYLVEFKYNTKYKCLDIYVSLYDPTASVWPAEEVRLYVDVLTGYSGTILPACEGCTSYTVISDYLFTYGYISIFCYTSDANKPVDYVEVLVDAGYTVANYPDLLKFVAVSPNEDLEVTVYYYDEDFASFIIEVTFNVQKLTEWPANDILTYLPTVIGDETDTVVPSFEAGGYTFEYNEGVNQMKIVCYNPIETIDSYHEKVTKLGWTVTESGVYEDDYFADSPDGKVRIEFYISYEGQFVVDISKAPNTHAPWPAQDVADMLADMGVTGDIPVPTFTGYTGFELSYYPNYGMAGVLGYVPEGQEEAAVESYYAQLTNLGYTFLEDGYAEDGYYILENTDLAIGAYSDFDGMVIIDVYKYYKSIEITTVEETYANWAEAVGLDFALPTFTFSKEVTQTVDSLSTNPLGYYGQYIDIIFTCAAADAAITMTEINVALQGAGVTLTNYSTYYVGHDANNLVDVYLDQSGGTITLEICPFSGMF